MNRVGERNGLIVLGVILVIVLTGSLAAYRLTGDRGLEERFLDAAGIHQGNDTGDHGGTGFSLEGNPALYVIVVVGLGIACIAAYRYFKI
jgi:hypothetical protein